MDRIGGFSESEIKRLVEFIKEGKKQGKPLTELFKQFGGKYCRSAGSVRNFYYQLLKTAQKNDTVYEKYLKDSNLHATKSKPFDENESRFLLQKILEGKLQNVSVRRTLIGLGDGDDKKVLRYQNKFRNMLKQTPDILKKCAIEQGYEDEETLKGLQKIKSDGLKMSILRRDINDLVERIAQKSKAENILLKERVNQLEEQNKLLISLLPQQANNLTLNKS